MPMPFRLRNNTKITEMPKPEKFIDEPLDEVLSQLENVYRFHLLKDVQGVSCYRLITMKKHCHILEMIAHVPECTDKWIVVDAFPLREENAEDVDC